MARNNESEAKEPQTGSAQEAESTAKVKSAPYSAFGEDFSDTQYIIFFGLAFVTALVLYVVPLFEAWGWMEGGGQGAAVPSKGALYSVTAVVLLGVYALGRIARNALRQGFIAFELPAIIGILIPYGYSIYNMYFGGGGGVYLRESAAAVGCFLFYEYCAAKILDKALGKDEPLPFAEAPTEKKMRVISYLLFAFSIMAAGALFAYARYYLGESFESSVIRGAVAFLVIGPVNLVFTAHFAVKFAMLLLERRGFTLKETGLLRRILDAYVVVFTKSGVLTQGAHLVTDIAFESYGTVKPTQLLRYVGAVELKSKHPLAKALLRQLRAPEAGWPDVEDFKVHEGVGVEGKIGDTTVKAGRRELFAHMDYSLQHKAQSQEQSGNTVIYMGFGDEANGAAYMVDTLRPGMRKMCMDLHERRKLVCLLSSDSFQSVKSIAEKCRIKNYISEATPEEKVVEIRNHKKKGRSVIVVARPEADEEILKEADIAVMLKKAKAEVPDYIDITVKPDKFYELPLLVKVARNVLGSIHLNVLFVSVFNVGAAALLAFDYLSAPLAALLASLFGLIMLLNILRSRKVPEEWL